MKGRWNTAAVTKAGTVVAMSVPTARRIPRRTKCGMVHDRCSFQESECCRRMVSKSADPVPAFAASYSSRTFFGTPTNTSPPVGGTSLRIPLPVVVLPQPLSPTRQKISPLPTSRSTPSTARTYSGLALRNAARNPRRFSNQTRKSRRTKYGSRATSRRLLRRRRRGVQVARREVALAHRIESRLLIDAQLPGVLASLEEFEDLRLDHDVQRGHRFVRDHDPRIACEGHGDHDPLPHAAGELVRVLLGALAVDADEFKQLADALHRGFFVHLVVDDDRLRDLVPDPLHRIQGVHRPLEDDRDVLPPDPAELAFRDLGEVIPDVIDRPLDDLPVRREEAHD